jgi:LysR family nitrogen assimilation transcriptional regulator
MELRTLRYFVYIAEARSFSQAAIHLRIAQPALSRQIAKLEDEVGLALFVRTGRRLELTDAGQQLLSRAHMLLRQASTLVEEIRSLASDPSGTLVVGVSPATCEALAPMLIRACAARYPQLTLRFVEGFSGLILEQLLNQELSMCVVHNPPEHHGLGIHPLLTEAMYLVGPPPNSEGLPPAAAGMSIETLPMILPNPTHGLRLLLEKALGGRQFNIAQQADGLMTTKALVEAGLGYTILPYSAIHGQVRARQLSAHYLADMHIPWTMSLVSRVEQHRSTAIQAIEQIILGSRQSLLGPEAIGAGAEGAHAGP